MNRTTAILLPVFISAFTAASVYAADENPKTTSKNDTAQNAPAKDTVRTAPAAAATRGSAGGLVVFKDPVTGQIRQPDASEIGALLNSQNVQVTTVQPGGPVIFQGPGNSRGVKLGDDSMAFMVVTKGPDGKLVESCVTGDKAAASRVASGTTSGATQKAAKVVLDEK